MMDRDAGRARYQGTDDNELEDAMASLEESIRFYGSKNYI
jgi:hypothetical protein